LRGAGRVREAKAGERDDGEREKLDRVVGRNLEQVVDARHP